MTQHIPELPDDSLDRFKRDYLETPMTTQQNEQHAIERDFDATTLRGKGAAWLIGIVIASMMLLWFATSHAQTARTAVITFAAPTARTDGSTITGALSYEVWQGLKGAAKGKAGTINNTTTTISTGLQGGREYCWYVIAVEAGGGSSAPSNEACKAFSLSEPNVVTITVT